MRPILSSITLLSFLIGCRTGPKVEEPEVIDTGGIEQVLDADSDGYPADEDCDDSNSVVNPGAEEICDGVDNNCDGEVDEGVTTTFYEDVDGDGFGNADSFAAACQAAEGYVATGTDCDDYDPEVYPSAPEQCDGLDNDCDGEIDEDVRYEWFADADGDGFGDPDSAYETCDPPAGYVIDDTDCDDTESSAFPGGEEVCDEVDNDCNGETDENVTTTYYQDIDSDGFGVAEKTAEACDVPTGYAADPGDCNDGDGTISPNATEVCDGVDNNCDGDTDSDAIDQETFFADSDGDGFGDVASTTTGCELPSGYSTDDTDCDDADSAINPDAEEVCDGADNDCDGDIDTDAVDLSTFYADSDGDGYGGGSSTEACDLPSGYADNAEDCDDGESAANPGETEVCDEIDNDCDGETDEGLTSTWYLDFDADGYGGADFTQDACTQPSGYVSDSTDCDDGESAANPGETEVCDEIDNDCDGDTDEGQTTIWYLDYDSDGYGGSAYSQDACTQPSGYVADGTDCDDGEPDANPGETEVCDELDNDCDGDIDEDDAADALTWYEDADGDTYGNPSVSDLACDAPAGFVADDTDCDDDESSAYPGAPELPDSLDNDCDGDIDEDLWIGTGADGDLEVTATTDLSADASNSRSDADAVTLVVSAISGTTITVTETVSGIAAGDEVLVVNLHGSDDNHSATGAWEFASVASVSTTTITLVDSLVEVFGETSNSDLTDQSVFLQRVPHYEDVTVYAGALLTTTPWDGERYGVLAFRASGTVSIEDGGAISVDELGYWGGETGTCNNCDSFQGESYAGEGDGNEYGGPYNETIGAYAANYGGGGANITGGGGEHAGGATPGDSWNGGGYTAPEAGDTYGDADLSGIFFGSGGGGVWNGGSDDAGEDPGPGGDGGGILYIGAAEIIAEGSDAMMATGGTTPYWADGSWTYGAGGGAGGSIYLIVGTLEATTDSLSAAGGFGESTHTRVGGDGGEGRIRVDFSSLNGYSFGEAGADTELNDITEPDAGYSDTP